MNLSPKLRRRLVQLCGMLGSDFAGERASAALLVTRLLKTANLTWEEVIREVGKPHPHHQPPPQQHRRPTPAAVAEFCLERGLTWNRWEWQFLQSMRRRTRATEKQWVVLARLYEKAARSGEP